MTKRQPKGTPTGGQFAEGKTPAGPDLPVDVTPWIEDEYDETIDHAVDAASNLTGGQLAKFTQDDEQDQDAGFYKCGACGDTAQAGASNICPNCSSEMEWECYDPNYDDCLTKKSDDVEVDDFVSSVSDEDKQRYVNSITAMYEEFASMGLQADIARYLPNERGFQLLADSSLKITGELETSNGVAWKAVLDMDGKTIHVENRGDGGSNWYTSDDGFGGWKLEAELNELVSRGFPGLGPEALDDFCSIVEVAHEGDPK